MKGVIQKISILSFLLIFFLSPAAFGADNADSNTVDDATESPPKIGNFALPDSQQPGSLVSIGQGILDANQTQVYSYGLDYIGPGNYAASVTPYILHGVTDNFSILVAVPVEANKIDDERSSGMADSYFQLEYAYYQQSTSNYTALASIIGGASLPTGSSQKNPPTGFGAPTFIIGTTYGRMYVNWFGFTSPAVLITTSNNGTRYSNDYLYQFGLGRNIFDIGTDWLFAGLVELDGDYEDHDIVNNVVDPDSGGNIILVTPSLWISSKKLTIQFGVGYPVVQRLYGEQSKTSYILTGNLGWTF